MQSHNPHTNSSNQYAISLSGQSESDHDLTETGTASHSSSNPLRTNSNGGETSSDNDRTDEDPEKSEVRTENQALTHDASSILEYPGDVVTRFVLKIIPSDFNGQRMTQEETVSQLFLQFLYSGKKGALL